MTKSCETAGHLALTGRQAVSEACSIRKIWTAALQDTFPAVIRFLLSSRS